MRCYCCNRADATFKDVRMDRYYCTLCKDEINVTIYNQYGLDDLYRAFKIDDVQGELASLFNLKEKHKEQYLLCLFFVVTYKYGDQKCQKQEDQYGGSGGYLSWLLSTQASIRLCSFDTGSRVRRMIELERIDKEIEKQMEVVRLAEIRVYDKDRYGKAPWNELNRLQQEREIILSGVKWKHHGSGTVLIDDKFIYALLTGKWSVLGKNKWYRSKSIKHFIDNYVRKDDD